MRLGPGRHTLGGESLVEAERQEGVGDWGHAGAETAGVAAAALAHLQPEFTVVVTRLKEGWISHKGFCVYSQTMRFNSPLPPKSGSITFRIAEWNIEFEETVRAREGVESGGRAA